MRASDRYVVIPLPLLDAPGMALKVYAVLRSYADLEAVAWPSRKTIAARAAVSVDSVDNAVRWLVAEGWVAVEARYSPEGDRTSNRYRVYGAPEPPGGRRIAPTPSPDSPQGVAAESVQELDPLELDPLNEPSPTARGAASQATPPPTAAEPVPLFGDQPLTRRQVMARNERVMRAYLDWRAVPVARDVMRRLRAQVSDALNAGVPEDTVKLGLVDWTEHGNGPSTLAAFIDARARGREPGQRPAKASRIGEAVAVAAMLRAEQEGASRALGAAPIVADALPLAPLPAWAAQIGAMR